MDDMKFCHGCEKVYPRTKEYFYANKAYLTKGDMDGLLPRCKTCHHALREPRPDVPEGHRRCPRCEGVFPATDAYFCVNKSRRDGRNVYCNPCMALVNAEKYATAKSRARSDTPPATLVCTVCEKVKPATKEYFFEQPTCLYGLRKVCKECQSNRQDHWNKNNHDRRRAIDKRHYEKNGPVKANRRRARVSQAEGAFTVEDIQQLFAAQEGKCAYCQCQLTNYHIDHVVPLFRGGTNWPNNLRLACGPCNWSKGHKLIEEWRPELLL